MRHHRILLALRIIGVSYRSALRHADTDAVDHLEWLNVGRCAGGCAG